MGWGTADAELQHLEARQDVTRAHRQDVFLSHYFASSHALILGLDEAGDPGPDQGCLGKLSSWIGSWMKLSYWIGTEAKFCIYENFGYVRITLNCSYTKKIVIIVRLSKSMNLMREEKLRKVVFCHYECTEPQKLYRLW